MADSSSLIGQAISHYIVVEKIGTGGMGVVYKAEDTELRRIIALKFLPEQDGADPKAREQLRREARTASSLNHPNICTIYEVGEQCGKAFIAMEYVEGKSLSKLIRPGRLPVETVVRYGTQIASALEHAHNHGVIHRDLKPLNVIVTPQGDAKILDFGLARQGDPAEFDKKTLETLSTEAAIGLAGTFPYMAPEQFEGSGASPRTDIWSLGIVLYEMASGSRPFHGQNLYRVCTSIVRDAPPPLPPNIPRGLGSVIQRCLEKEPARRYHSAGEVRAALEIAAEKPEHGTEQKRAKEPNGSSRRAKWMVAAIGLIAITGAGVAYRGRVTQREAIPKSGQLAVLPMSMNETDPTMVAFEKGLVETLTARLTQVTQKHAIQVIPTSAIQGKGIGTVEQAHKEFGANLGLELNLQRSRSGEEIRVNFNLIDATTMLQVGGGTVTGKSSDTFNVEDKVCEGVINALEIQLEPSEKRELLANKTSQPGAYDFYVQGRGYLGSFNRPESFESAILVFNHALELDQNYGPAYAGLGKAYWNEYELTRDEKWIVRAQAACQRAVELNRTRPEGHACLGAVLKGTGKYEQALEQYQEAIELDPSDDSAYIGLAGAYEKLGKTREAEATFQQAIQLRPSYPLAYNRLGEFQMEHGQYEDAARMFRQVIALAPDNYAGYSNLGSAYLQQNRYEEAVPMLERSIALRRTAEALSNLATAYFQLRRFTEAAKVYEDAVRADENNYEVWGNLGDAYYWSAESHTKAPAAYQKASALALTAVAINPRDANALGYLAEYQAMLGRQEEARKYLEQCLRLKPQDPALLFNTALIYNKLGDEHDAIAWLEKSIASGMPRSSLLESPNFDNLHGNSRFMQLANEKENK